MKLPVYEFWRLDFAYDIQGIKVSDEGFWEVTGVAAIVGPLVYLTEDGERHTEYATAEVLANYAKGLVGKPVTRNHPPEKVTPENFKEYVVGTVLDCWFDTKTEELKVKLAINDADAQQDIDRGVVELSPGYYATFAPPPEDFEHEADGIQITRKYNHLALVEEARGGPKARLHLDSKGNLMKKKDEKKEDKKHEDEYKEKYDALKKKHDALQAKVDAMQAKMDAMEKKEDGEKKEDEEEKKKDGERNDSVDIDLLVAQRFEDYRLAREAAERFNVDVADASSAFEIKKKVVLAKTGKLRQDSKDYVDTAFDAVCEVFPAQDSVEHLSDVFRNDGASSTNYEGYGIDFDNLIDPLDAFKRQENK